MGSNAILRAIADETDREVERLIGEATERAEEILGNARRTAEARIDEAVSAADPQLQADAARTINAARVELLHSRALQGAARLTAAYELAQNDLQQLADAGDARWRTALSRLATDALSVSGDDSTLIARPADCEHIFAALGADSRVVRDVTVTAGVVARSADGTIEVDATVASRLLRTRRLLAEQVAAILQAADEKAATDPLAARDGRVVA
jgi:vacuolar-type H+-ATPase subunit E/Vma4